MGLRAWIGAFVVVIGAVALAAPAGAATIRVTTPADEFGSGDRCALREAVQAASTDAAFGGCVRENDGPAPRDMLVLRGGRVHTLSRVGADNSNSAGDLDVTSPIVIDVRGKGRAIIDAGGVDRAIDIKGAGRLVAARIVVRNGNVAAGQPDSDTSGGAIAVGFGTRLTLRTSRVAGNSALGNLNCTCGGAISVAGKTVLDRVLLAGNHADNIGGGVAVISGDDGLTMKRSTASGNEASFGGGVYAGGFDTPTTIRASTISGNEAFSASIGFGGGIHAAGSGTTISVDNSTISGNRANVNGGGINRSAGQVSLNAVTITRNIADADGNGVGQGGGLAGSSTTLRNSIVARNRDRNPGTPAHDCGSGIVFTGANLVGTDGGCPAFGETIAAANPKLGPLAANGGPTRTHALRLKSRAVNRAGKDAPKVDQRGVRRDKRPDIGAYELR